MRRLAFFLALMGACGGQGAPPETPATEPDSEPQPLDTAGRPGPIERAGWSSLEEGELVDYVRLEAVRRLRELGVGVEGFGRWRLDPASAPELGGRACDELLRLALADLAAGDHEGAQRTILLVRARARNRNLAYAGATMLAVIARSSARDPQEAIQAGLRELPPSRLGSATVSFHLYQSRPQLDAAIERARQTVLSLESASEVLFTTHVLGDLVEHRAVYLAALEAVRSAAHPPASAFSFERVDLGAARGASPVRVAVWDTGTALERFEGQVFTNPGEQPNGIDDDGNGLVDDLHGIVSDFDPEQTSALYVPAADVLATHAPFLRGLMDLRAGRSSTEAAQQLLRLLASATDAASLARMEAALDDVMEWAHGTHVAGILLEGLPNARLAVFRSARAAESRVYRNRGPTDAELVLERTNMDAVAAFIRAHRIQVVNLSLGFARDYLEAQLRNEAAAYPTDALVRRRAAEVHARRRAAWEQVFASCPDTLFVVAAGNANRDVVEYDDLPAAIEAPNVIAVGAVDPTGQWAAFTSSGRPVRVFDLGVEVESVLPDGARLPLSGTSMAAPAVANAAAKVLSVRPGASPAEVIELLVRTGAPIAAPFSGVIVRERAAVERARRR